MLRRNKISRVVLRNYKSIKVCDVSLGSLTFLVGPNGAGKSNFVESLRFLSYALSTSLEQAIENRAGFKSIAYRGGEQASEIRFGVDFDLGRDGKDFPPLWQAKSEVFSVLLLGFGVRRMHPCLPGEGREVASAS